MIFLTYLRIIPLTTLSNTNEVEWKFIILEHTSREVLTIYHIEW